jgi:hypothetical protein
MRSSVRYRALKRKGTSAPLSGHLSSSFRHQNIIVKAAAHLRQDVVLLRLETAQQRRSSCGAESGHLRNGVCVPAQQRRSTCAATSGNFRSILRLAAEKRADTRAQPPGKLSCSAREPAQQIVVTCSTATCKFRNSLCPHEQHRRCT